MMMTEQDLYASAKQTGIISAKQDNTLTSAGMEILWKELQQINENPEKFNNRITQYLKHFGGALPAHEPISAIFSTRELIFTCVGVDGSQIYPDLFSPVQFGWVSALAYEMGHGIILKDGLCVSEQILDLAEDEQTIRNYIDLSRAVIEMKVASDVADKGGSNKVVLLDGSLIPWASFSRNTSSRIRSLLDQYQTYFSKSQDSLIVSVISNPHSRSVINLIEFSLVIPVDAYKPVRYGYRDRDLFKQVLKNGERSALFFNGSIHNQRFAKKGLGIYFFYLKVNDEIMRIELPQWIADESKKVDQVHSAVHYDSTDLGYPYTLAQAHYHVVLKNDVADAIRNLAESAYYQAGGKVRHWSAKNRIKYS